MRTLTSPTGRWRRWRPFGVAKRLLLPLLAVAFVSSLLALRPTAHDGTIAAADAELDGRVTAASLPASVRGAAIVAAPLPAPSPAPDVTPAPAEDPTEVLALIDDLEQEAREQRRAEEQQAAADQRRDLWYRLADCESGFRQGGTPIPGSARWDYGLSADEGAPFEGGLQFAPTTWDAFRDASMPDHAGNASPAQQIAVAERVLDAQGWGAWPICSRMLGLRG